MKENQGSPLAEITVKAEIEEIPKIRRLVREAFAPFLASEEEMMKIELCVHEIAVNIALYAYPETKGSITVKAFAGPESVYVEIRDEGLPFNPEERPDPDVLKRIECGERGGLGICLYKALSDGHSYRRENGENVLTIEKKIS